MGLRGYELSTNGRINPKGIKLSECEGKQRGKTNKETFK